MTEEETIQTVWNKGAIPIPEEAAHWRQDPCGAWIARSQYGRRDSEYGWEIDRLDPDGDDSPDNLQPLQWENHVAKRGGQPHCVVTAHGARNIKPSEADPSR